MRARPDVPWIHQANLKPKATQSAFLNSLNNLEKTYHTGVIKYLDYNTELKLLLQDKTREEVFLPLNEEIYQVLNKLELDIAVCCLLFKSCNVDVCINLLLASSICCSALKLMLAISDIRAAFLTLV